MALPATPPVDLDHEFQPVPFHVSVDVVGATVAVAGELDRPNGHHVLDGLAALVSGGCRQWTVDMTAVSFCDAAGLRVLLTGHHLARRHGCELVLERPSRCVHRLLLLTGLDRVLDVRPGGPVPAPAAGGQRPLPSAGPLRSARRIRAVPGTGRPRP
ncbi:anti-sigma-factor [Blastococcus sp. TBT05-19]|uniref:STAS domain-containing protein n=1 Tax=Blastococcus sp. TBT05-19 TaxID=2250581 RepID=UPI000DE81D9B|nr:STAS domain-containing protein [Blastococcus sp. TBT05-19]RBY90368.1 anti-sigma-factor [Blastococcus sp. TBT05-19]